MDGESFSHQIAALPFRERRGRVDVLLVTTRDTRRWVIPKGWPMDGRKDYNAAKIEAFEEAGLEGKISKTPIGTFEYCKRLNSIESRQCRVDVYPLKVERLLRKWPEKGERWRHWFSIEAAAEMVSEEQLRALILNL